MSHYLKIWRDSGKPSNFEWKLEHVRSYRCLPKHEYFAANLKPGSRVPARLKQIWSLQPKVLVDV